MQYDKNTQEQMFAMIASRKQSGLSQKDYCQQNHIRYHVFHYWYKRYRDEQSASPEAAFIPLNVRPSFFDTSCSNIEVILADGKRILFHQAVSSDFLKAVIS
ncbi:MAG: hypothetical protein AVDCRST_MAG96-4300 [uncultured Segetibacter sp.]|uniref:Transposase n=1 Tax=uncultured Segetibacter sp. TaxID=481133 RepID=A0A6J4U5C1_9BACT|nr:MAG: hypothetical protein AVDCRST_MAG96-4300 [uncultured Segetibacter sp.]